MTDRVLARLKLLQTFLNTVDLESGTDAVDTAAALHSWLVDHGLSAGSVTKVDLALAHELRDALRAYLEATQLADDRDAAGGVNSTLARLPLSVAFTAAGEPILAPTADRSVSAALADIVSVIPEAAAAGLWDRVKMCPANTCHWVFYDESRNCSRRWCSMGVCGNRTKSRAFRERQRQAPV